MSDVIVKFVVNFFCNCFLYSITSLLSFSFPALGFFYYHAINLSFLMHDSLVKLVKSGSAPDRFVDRSVTQSPSDDK